MRRAQLSAVAAVGIVCACARPVEAEPQASVGVTAGAALQDVVGPSGMGASLHLGARGDVLLLRRHNGEMALGPYVDGATAGFHDVDVGGGLEWLLPLTSDLPLVLSAGGLARDGDGRQWAPGVEGTLFVGSRSFNFHSWYGLAAGAFVQSRWIPASPSTVDVVFGVQLDLELIALPALFVWDALFAHGS